MLSLLKIRNVALIDSIEVEFGAGLNLLTGETGSGKSIIVDSLAALTGERVSADLIKEGEQTATIEGLFSLPDAEGLSQIFEESGIDLDPDELIVRREISTTGKNRVFINNQLVTQSFLKQVGRGLLDIHGQGEQATLFDPATHLEMLDTFAGVESERARTGEAFRRWAETRGELASLRKDESDKLQLLDILKFQVDEIARANIKIDEDRELEEEKRRLNNVEKLSTLSDESYRLLYEQDESTLATLDKALRKIELLAEFDPRFDGYRDPLESARAVIEDAATTARDFRGSLEFSPKRLEEIEDRLAEIGRLSRKYGGSIETVLEHLAESERRLENIETAELRENELEKTLAEERRIYIEAATDLRERRVAAAARFSKELETNLNAVALEKAKFEVRVSRLSEDGEDDRGFSPSGIDHVEFYFSANPGESPKPLAKVASGGEASRLMLIVKTTAKGNERGKSAVFDEIDAGIGGRVAEAVGLKLKLLAASQQVLCVTHQPQVASLADHHFVVEKTMGRSKTSVGIRELTGQERIDEIARMLAGETITDSARTHAREMIEGARQLSAAGTQRRRGAKG